MGSMGPESTAVYDGVSEDRVRLDDVHLALGGRSIAKGLTCGFPRGKVSVLMGGSGAGKSTLLRMVGGLVRPDSGRILVAGEDITRLSEREMFRVRERIGMLFQGGALLDSMSVFDNVALPLRETTRLKEPEIRDKVTEILRLMQLEDAHEKLPSEISGGMIKRAGLARALVTEPKLILYDEPEAGLDPEMSANVIQVIRRLQEDLRMTSVIVTHSIACARHAADRVAVFLRGRITAIGPPDEVIDSDEPRLRKFFGLKED